jgi:hypothetical protein
VQVLLKKTTSGIPLYALSKYSKEANGGDFTVVSLNDNGAGGSEIYLGKTGRAVYHGPAASGDD